MSATDAVGEPEPAPDHEQLDALSGMAERRSAPAPDIEPAPSTAESVDDYADVDPLTAPLTSLETVDVETPIAAQLHTQAPPAAVEPDDSVAVEDVDAIDEAPHSTSGPLRVQRIAQVLILAAALSNLALAGMGAVAEGSTALLGLALVNLAIWTGAAITFLHWVSRMYHRVRETSPVAPRHGEVMAVAGWMIPVAGFLIGYRVLQDLWTGSDPSTRHDAEATPAKARLIDVWLLGLVTATIFGYALPMALGDSVLWGVLASVGVLAAGAALVQIMTTIGGWTQQALESGDIATPADGTANDGTVTTRTDHMEPVSTEAQSAPVEDEPTPVAAD